MVQPPEIASKPPSEWRLVALMAAGLTLARLIGLFATPLELYPDEAQYWLWSRTLDWGYYSKPPMIAWTIWATTALGGNEEAFVRLAAPLCHGIILVAVYAIGRRLYGAASGLAAALLYGLMPAVQLSGLVIATDSLMLVFLSLGLLAYVELPQSEGGRRLGLAAGLGAAMGLGFLSKYAAIYGLMGIGLHLLSSREARKVWDLKTIALAVGTFFLVLAPNLAWNAAHGFSTVQHTAANAAWGGRQLFNFGHLGSFIASQFGVFGPVPMAVLIGGTIWLARSRSLSRQDILLLCFCLPAFLIVTTQAFISRANANWSAAGYVAGAVLVGAWLVRWKANRWLWGTVALQGLLALVFLACVIRPPVAETLGLANAFKRAKGWEQMTEVIIERLERERYRGIDAVAVNDRFLFNAMAYYGRDIFIQPDAPPLRMWVREAHPQNQAETTDPLTQKEGKRVLLASLEQVYRDEMARDFAATSGSEIVSIRLDHKRKRRVELMIGDGFLPRPRDPVTGLPTPP